MIDISNICYFTEQVNYDIDIYDNVIRFRAQVFAFKCIRLFGQYVSDIHLNMVESAFLREKYFLHVNEYCHQTLNVLQVYGDHSNLFGMLKHPFEIVETFLYTRGTIGSECEHFKRLFPCLREQ